MLCHVLEVTSDPDEHIKRRLHSSNYIRTKFIKDAKMVYEDNLPVYKVANSAMQRCNMQYSTTKCSKYSMT